VPLNYSLFVAFGPKKYLTPATSASRAWTVYFRCGICCHPQQHGQRWNGSYPKSVTALEVLFRSLKLRACLGFASGRQMWRLRPGESQNVIVIVPPPFGEGFLALKRARKLRRGTLIRANSLKARTANIPAAWAPGRLARSPAFGELPRRPPDHNPLPRKRLSSITLLGQDRGNARA